MRGGGDARGVVVRISAPQEAHIDGIEASGGATQHSAVQTDNQSQIVWTIDLLPGLAEEQLRLNLTSQSSRSFDLQVQITVEPTAATARIDVKEPLLELAMGGAREILYGQPQIVTITLTNPGNGDAENVMLHLPAVGGDDGQIERIGLLRAGEQKLVRLNIDPQEAGRVRIVAEATADGGLQAEASHEVLVRRARLTAKLQGPALQYYGAESTYRLKVENLGDAVATNVAAAVKLPPNTQVLSASAGGENSSGLLAWSVGRLDPGGELILEFVCRTEQTGDNRFAARVKGDGDLLTSAETSTRIEAIADLKLTLEDPQGPQPIGRDAVYEIHIVNRGSKAAEDVTVVAQFSDGVEPVSAEGGQAEIVTGQVVFAPLRRIEAGGKIVLKVKARAKQAGSHRFRTEVTCKEPQSRLVAETTTRFYSAEISESDSLDAPQ